MPLPVPELDDLDYDAFLREAIESISRYAPGWTDRNPSDPGIAVLELLCWLSEALLYRIDRVTDQAYLSFLRLLAGVNPGEAPKVMERYIADPTLDPEYLLLLLFLHEIESGGEPVGAQGIQAAAAQYLGTPYRIVTEDDIHDHFQAALDLLPAAKNSLLGCVPRVHERETRIYILAREHATPPELYELSSDTDGFLRAELRDEHDESLEESREFLEKYFRRRKPVGTRLLVTMPSITSLRLEFEIVTRPFADSAKALRAAALALAAYLDPVRGAYAAAPLDIALPVEELRLVLSRSPGVERVRSLFVRALEPLGQDSGPVQNGTIYTRGLVRVTNIHARVLPDEAN